MNRPAISDARAWAADAAAGDPTSSSDAAAPASRAASAAADSKAGPSGELLAACKATARAADAEEAASAMRWGGTARARVEVERVRRRVALGLPLPHAGRARAGSGREGMVRPVCNVRVSGAQHGRRVCVCEGSSRAPRLFLFFFGNPHPSVSTVMSLSDPGRARPLLLARAAGRQTTTTNPATQLPARPTAAITPARRAVSQAAHP